MIIGFRVCEKKCDQCLFSDNKIVSDDRKKEVLKKALKKDSFFTCHKTLDTCCRGYWDEHKKDFSVGRFCEQMGLVRFV